MQKSCEMDTGLSAMISQDGYAAAEAISEKEIQI